MTTVNKLIWIAILTFVLLLLAPVAASAQEEVGGLYGTVTDVDGEPLPGVGVSLEGMGAPQVQVTDTMGQYRFVGLDPGVYGLRAALDGFSTVDYPNIDIRAGRNTTIAVQLPAAVEEVIVVTAESPLLDERKVAQGSIVTQIDLEAIPTARDPWSVLNQAAGVVLDRVNVGGNESGNQSIFVAPNSDFQENRFLLDGIEITDMTATGTSPTYYDFDQFTQMEIVTGGTEITNLTPGVSINMVTKRGTNEFRGSARFFVTDADGYFGALEEGTPQIDESDLAAGQQEPITGNRTDRIHDIGFEAGGPAWRDRVWLWGSWAQNEIRRFKADGQPDAFALENTAVKLNAQLTGSNSLLASWNAGDKRAEGLGAGPGRAPEATWSQRGPTGIYKVEDTQLFGSSLFLSGTWSKVDGGASFTARGGVGPDAPEILFDSDGVQKRNSWSASISRVGEEWRLDGSRFFALGSTSHELKFGGRLKDYEYSEEYSFPGRQLMHFASETLGEEPGPVDFLIAYRGGVAPGSTDHDSLWLQDTMTWDQWAVNVGLRWDHQEGRNEPSAVAANPAFPDLLPALEFPGNDAGGFDWESICPRVGATYALGEERKTLLRTSFARFAQQFKADHLYRVSPVGDAYGYFAFFDTNDNNTWDGQETDGEPVFLWATGFDPSNPTALDSPNANDPDLQPETTDELRIGVEHAFRPELVTGFHLTYRRVTDILEERDFVREQDGSVRLATRDDYLLETTLEGELPGGSPFTADFYALQPLLEYTGGSYLTNGDRERDYLGATLSLIKRLSNRWMLRAYLDYGEAEWRIPASFRQWDDPTDNPDSDDNDGDLYYVASRGRWGSMMQSSWAFNVNGMVQVMPDRPWGFNLAGNVYGRQGYPLPYRVRYRSRIDGALKDAQAVSLADQFRAEDLYTVDLRLEKEFATTDNLGLTFSIDAFNVFNENTVLRRELQLSGARPDYVNETLAPRIYRLAVRLDWR